MRTGAARRRRGDAAVARQKPRALRRRDGAAAAPWPTAPRRRFFGNFMTSIAENAAGGQAEKIDKDMWGNPDLKNIMTIIDINLIMQQDAAADGFSAAALEKQFAAAAKDA